MVKSKSSRKQKKTVTTPKNIKMESAPSLFEVNKVNNDGEYTFDFPGFSLEEFESSKEKIMKMEKAFLENFDDGGEECTKDVQKKTNKKRKVCGRQKKKKATQKKIKIVESHLLAHVNNNNNNHEEVTPEAEEANIYRKMLCQSVSLSNYGFSKDKLIHSAPSTIPVKGSPPSAIESPPHSVKRPGYYNGVDGLPTKKPRIAHIHNKCEEVLYGRSESSALTPVKPTSPSKPNTYHINNNINKYSGNSLVPGTTSVQQPPPKQEEPTKTITKPLLPKLNGKPPPSRWDPVLPQISSSTSSENDRNFRTALKQPPSVIELPKYLSEYTTIVTLKQRCCYEEEFNADYAEYRNLHSIVDQVSRKFAQLEERLRREEKGSNKWKIIKNRIVKEYVKNKCNTKHQDAKRRFQYLHDKLSHIKKLVLEFDSAQHT